MTNPETPAPMTDIGPRYTTPTCRGCPVFKEERWSEPSGDGETMDGGEQQTCLAANREIATYGSVAVHPPHWCPGIHRSSPSTAAWGWQPIEAARKDGTRILCVKNDLWTVTWWDSDKFVNVRRKKRPYWRSQLGDVFGVRWDRDTQPKTFLAIAHLFPTLPEPPK